MGGALWTVVVAGSGARAYVVVDGLEADFVSSELRGLANPMKPAIS